LSQFDTAAGYMPKPEIDIRDKNCKVGLIYFGANRPAVLEGLDELERAGVRLNAMRLKAFPFNEDVKAFCDAHDQIFVVEQNRDAQMRSLLMTEADVSGTKLIPTLSHDGTPMTAAFVRKAVLARLHPEKAAAAE
jgi:2-oxoglutarate ferredoxin oxidoreductase subunit alpha